MNVGAFLTAPVAHRRRTTREDEGEGSQGEWSRETTRTAGGEGSVGSVTKSHGTGPPPPPPQPTEGPILQVWHLLAAITGIMSILLAAHYAFVMESTKRLIQEHEMGQLTATMSTVAKTSELERRIVLLEQGDRDVNARELQVRQDIERMERDMTLIRERQDQVRARLKINGGP